MNLLLFQDTNFKAVKGNEVKLLLWLLRTCNLNAYIHSSTGPVVYSCASRHEGLGFNPQGGYLGKIWSIVSLHSDDFYLN